ncbi:MAG: tRNA epoxyqueuosine(34) reductase QueG [Eubacteriaceae bacterium]
MKKNFILSENRIREIALEQGIDLVGFFKPDPLVECLPFLEERIKKGFETGFENGCPEERIQYTHCFPEAKSGIGIGINYYQEIPYPRDGKERSKIASVAWGEDYHRVLKRKMTDLIEAVLALYPVDTRNEVSYKICVDTSPVVDRGTGYRCGFGFFGKNNCLINKSLGSYFFIGEILINQSIEFSSQKPIESQCGDCDLCIKACPHGALGEGYSLDPSRCISYLTQKKELSQEEETRITHYAYGCDLCQKVCPFNEGLNETTESSFLTKEDFAFPMTEELLEMSNSDFKRRFGRTAGGWRGKKTMIRNVKLLERNKKI